MSISTRRHVVWLWSSVLIKTISSYYIAVDPFLEHTDNCWTNFIVYSRNINLFWEARPAVISTQRYSYTRLDQGCTPNPQQVGTLNNTNNGLCETVRRNFHQKGIKCLAIALIYSNSTQHVLDAYWYIKTYWSNIQWQDLYINPSYPKQFSRRNLERLDIMDLTPEKIFLQALVPPEVKEWGKI